MLTSEKLAEREGYMTIEEITALKSLVMTLPKDAMIINIGAGKGTSAMALLETRDDLLVYSIDINKDFDGGSLRVEREALQEADLWDESKIEQIHGDSRQIGKEWDKGLVDMIFVDDGHYYEHVKGDILNWVPHMKIGGIMVFHDHGGQYDMGVSRAIDEFMDAHNQIESVDTLIAFKIRTRLPSKILSARYDFRYLAADVIDGLKELARSLGPDSIAINLGSGFGTSALAFMESRNDIKVISIDAHEDATDIGSLSNERCTMKEAGFSDDPRFEQIHGISFEVGEIWDRGEVDIVFVDASHSYEACKADALAWLPRIKRGGIIAFHDYWERYGYEVIRAVDEVMADYERIILIDCMIAFEV